MSLYAPRVPLVDEGPQRSGHVLCPGWTPLGALSTRPRALRGRICRFEKDRHTRAHTRANGSFEGGVGEVEGLTGHLPPTPPPMLSGMLLVSTQVLATTDLGPPPLGPLIAHFQFLFCFGFLLSLLSKRDLASSSEIS